MLAAVLGMPDEQVRVQYHEGLRHVRPTAATRMPRRPPRSCRRRSGKPVRVQFMRWDEHGWDHYGPAHLAEVRAGIDADGKLVAYEYHGWQHGWTVTATIHDLALQKPRAERAGGSNSIIVNPMSTGSMYMVPNRRVVSHAVPMVGYLRGARCARRSICRSRSPRSRPSTSSRMRSKMDPLEFRRKNIGDKRWLGVLDAAAEAAQLEAARGGLVAVGCRGRHRARHRLGTHHVSYGAAVADIEVNKRTGNIVAKHIFGAMDCRPGRQSGAGREPDHRPDDPVGEPRCSRRR